MLRFLALVAGIAVLGLFSASIFSDRLDRLLSRIALVAFENRTLETNPGKEQLLRSASIGTPYREYAAKTYLYGVGLGFAGAMFGVYVGATGIGLLGVGESGSYPGRGPALLGLLAVDGARIAILLTTGVLVGTVAMIATNALRWQLPSIRASARRREIAAGLPQTVAFTYALTRGGMSFPDVLRTISANERVFGESATEVKAAVRSIDLFNVDLVTAVQDLSDNSPSEQFDTFTENLASVLKSGGDVSAFLREQYERFREEAEDQQAEMLNVLATTAEVYVTVIVAGMLFLVTILLIIGLTAGNTLRLMRVLAYVVIPAGNLLFLAYLLDITQPLRVSSGAQRHGAAETGSKTRGRTVVSDGGYTRPDSAANHARLFAYHRLQTIRDTLSAPIQSLVARPHIVLYITVPVVVVVTLARLPTALAGGGVDLRVLDDLIVQATLVLMGTFAVVYEYSKRRLRRLEAALPDLLERLASLNEAGISIVSSFDRVRRSDIGALDDEVDRIWRDMTWGATAEISLSRFGNRVRTPAVTRVVTLLTNAMNASNEIGPVLRIAADQARADLHLRRQRTQEMFTYLVVVYVSFLVFLIVIGALEYVLIPSLPDMSAFSGGATGTPIGGLQGGDRDAYRLVFFHTALIQSVLSGLVAGVMGGGSIKDGMKHATVMLSVTYLALALLA